MADTEFRKVLDDGIWASADGADRENPEDVGITRTEGFNVAYEQLGSGAEPERAVFNQKMREWDGGFAEHARSGGCPQWDAEVNYHQYARVAVGLSKYRATVATGPAHGNAVNPTAEGQTVWRKW